MKAPLARGFWFSGIVWRLISTWPERVADRDASMNDVSSVEFLVIGHHVVANLRTDEEVPFNVEAESATEFPCEVITADVVGAGVVTDGVRLIEPGALCTNTGEEFAADALGPKRRSVNAVHAVEDRPIRLNVEGGDVVAVASTPRDLTADSEVLEEEEVATEDWESTSVGVEWAAPVCTGGECGTHTERNVELTLGVSSSREQNSKAEINQSFLQSKPPGQVQKFT